MHSAAVSFLPTLDLFGQDVARDRRNTATLAKWTAIWTRSGIVAAAASDYLDAKRDHAHDPLAVEWITTHPTGAVLRASPTILYQTEPQLGGLVILIADAMPSATNQSLRRILEIQDDLFGDYRFYMLGPHLARRAWPKALKTAMPIKRKTTAARKARLTVVAGKRDR